MRFFFYGTLMDADVLRAVTGIDAVLAPAVLRGWRRFAVVGEAYPMVVRDASGRVNGVLVRGLDARAARRLADYEGDEYVLRRVAVLAGGRRVDAHVYAPRRGRNLRLRGAWDLSRWRRRHKRRWLKALQVWQRRMSAVSFRA